VAGCQSAACGAERRRQQPKLAEPSQLGTARGRGAINRMTLASSVDPLPPIANLLDLAGQRLSSLTKVLHLGPQPRPDLSQPGLQRGPNVAEPRPQVVDDGAVVEHRRGWLRAELAARIRDHWLAGHRAPVDAEQVGRRRLARGAGPDRPRLHSDTFVGDVDVVRAGGQTDAHVGANTDVVATGRVNDRVSAEGAVCVAGGVCVECRVTDGSVFRYR
jgi:hypothetical protein